jgi:hypothetical protein
MSPIAPSPPHYHRYQPHDAKVTIEFAAEASDRILREVMIGFGALPRRGAEVGGFLLGRIEDGAVWVDGVEMIECEHRSGPSFVLSEHDFDRLEVIWQELQKKGGESRPVGMFRSNTREKDTVEAEDRELFTKYFRAPENVFLLIHPYVTKPCTGSFFINRQGGLPDTATDVFPLESVNPHGPHPRRHPLADPRQTGTHPGEDAAPAEAGSVDQPVAPMAGRQSESVTEAGAGVPAQQVIGAANGPLPEQSDPPQYGYSPQFELPISRRRSWIWIPLSITFLLLGGLLGFQAQRTFYSKSVPVDQSAFQIGLFATPAGESLHIRWHREAPAIQMAETGKVLIQDGPYTKSVDLDASALKNGSIIYPPISDRVTFRFEITIPPKAVLVETLEWSGGLR